MEGGPPMFGQDFTCPALLEDTNAFYPYGAVTRYGPTFQTVPVLTSSATGLVRVRSPLLTESRLMSFPPGTEMFQFPGFASAAYGFSGGYSIAEWVAPFGDPRIKACSRLPKAFRSVPRPSSPLGAKASTRCPCFPRPPQRQPHTDPTRHHDPAIVADGRSSTTRSAHPPAPRRTTGTAYPCQADSSDYHRRAAYEERPRIPMPDARPAARRKRPERTGMPARLADARHHDVQRTGSLHGLRRATGILITDAAGEGLPFETAGPTPRPRRAAHRCGSEPGGPGPT